jgi:hypothetical protein
VCADAFGCPGTFIYRWFNSEHAKDCAISAAHGLS